MTYDLVRQHGPELPSVSQTTQILSQYEARSQACLCLLDVAEQAERWMTMESVSEIQQRRVQLDSSLLLNAEDHLSPHPQILIQETSDEVE